MDLVGWSLPERPAEIAGETLSHRQQTNNKQTTNRQQTDNRQSTNRLTDKTQQKTYLNLLRPMTVSRRHTIETDPPTIVMVWRTVI